MVDVKSVSDVVAKWKVRAGAAGADYSKGAVAAAAKYATNAAKAGPAYDAGVQAAIGRGAYQKGINEAGSGKYSDGVQKKGSTRYAGGVAAGENNYNSGIQKVLSTLSSVQLPDRGPRGSPGNIQRVATIATALRQMKTGQAGA